MNTRLVASLLRELAAALEQPEERKPRLRKSPPEAATTARPAVVERIGRIMRNKGMTG